MKKLGIIAVLAAILVSGCQTAGPTDEELIYATMDNWREALVAQDADMMMETYSENFEGMEGGRQGGRT